MADTPINKEETFNVTPTVEAPKVAVKKEELKPNMVKVVSRLNRAVPIMYDGEGTMLPPRSPRLFDKNKLGPLLPGISCTPVK